MAFSTTASIKVLSLNCWGIHLPIVCKRRSERIAAIGNELAKGGYDIILLQEIWSQADYKRLCDKILPTMLHTHYWHSGVIGSGLCIFSKFPILETFAHVYSVNGYAHCILHGDWYAGKAVGLAKLAIGDMIANVYCTHTHADYSDAKYFRGEYLAHRVTQAYEMSEFIRLTSGTCDLVLAAGDFNLQPHELGYKIITNNATLRDAWITQRDGEKIHGMTSDANSFRGPGCESKCIDYIMYRNNSGTEIICKKCYVTMGKIPDQPYHYSDHEGVGAEFVIKRNVTVMAPERPNAVLEEILPEAISVIDTGMRTVKSARVFYVAMLVFSLTLLMFTNDVVLPFGLNWLLVFVRVVLVLVCSFGTWMIGVVDMKDKNGLLSARKNINRLLSR